MHHRNLLRMLSSTWPVALLSLQCWSPLVYAAPPPPPAAVDAGEQWLCAPGCLCSQDGTSAQCEAVTPQPSALPASLVSLTIRAHQLRHISNDTFQSLPGLQQLDLADGRISEVEEDAFSALPGLRSLSLSNNELSFLPARAFSANAALEALDLSRNPLVLPSIGPFLRSPSLRELSLADCSLRRFTPDAFTQLPSLRSLDLSSNAFSQLTSQEVQPFGNLSWLSVDADALSEDALAFLQDSGVEVDVFELVNTTDELLPEDQEDIGGAIYLGSLDKEYQYDEDAAGGDYAVLKNIDVAYDPESQPLVGQSLTGASESQVSPRWVEHPSWPVVLLAALLGSAICVSAALAYWAAVLVIRRRSAAQCPRDTLDRAFRQVASLPPYQQLQRPFTKPSSSKGYSRLHDEEDAPPSLPPRADRCTCLSCSEPVPTQPCIRFYERPASVHGAVPSRYYSLYPAHNQ